MLHSRSSFLALVAALAVAACGGPTSLPGPTNTLTPTPSSAPVTTPSPSATAAATLAPASAAPDPLIASIDTGRGPCAMAELDGAVWVTNYNDGTLARIDGATNEVDVTFDVGSQPCGLAATEGALWVGLVGENAVVRVDPASGQITDRIEVGGQPWDIQPGHGPVWVSVQTADDVVRIDPAQKKIVATIPSTGAVVVGLAVTDDEVWVANRLGSSITRIDPATNKTLPDIALEQSPYWFAVGAGAVVVSFSDVHKVGLLDPQTAQVSATVDVGVQPRDPGFVGGNFWVPSQGSDDVSIVSPTGHVKSAFPVADPHGIFVAESALGDGWILNFGGTTALRLTSGMGLP